MPFTPGGPSGTGAQNRLLCFDLATTAACAGQPYAVNLGAGSVFNAKYGYYIGNTSAIGSQIIVPVTMDSTQRIACFDTATLASCNQRAWGVRPSCWRAPRNRGRQGGKGSALAMAAS